MPPHFTDPLHSAEHSDWLRLVDLVVAVLLTVGIAFGMSVLGG